MKLLSCRVASLSWGEETGFLNVVGKLMFFSGKEININATRFLVIKRTTKMMKNTIGHSVNLALRHGSINYSAQNIPGLHKTQTRKESCCNK